MGAVLPFRSMDAMPNRIRELRSARNMHLQQLADRIGCSVTMLSDLERGNRELSYSWMRRIARTLKVQPADLLSQTDNSKSLSAEEQEWLAIYARAEPPQRALLIQMANTFVSALNVRAA
jgi:transcriptional regulator with XRE-family HTH domain